MARYLIDGDRRPGVAMRAQTLAGALQMKPGEAMVVIRRLSEGFSTLVELAACDDLALRELGLRAVPVHGAPALVEGAPAARARIERAWQALRAILEPLAPEAIRALRPPALAVDLAEIERRLEAPLPDDFVAWLALHDGELGEPGPFDWDLLSLADAAGSKRINDAVPDFGNAIDADPSIRAVWWHPRWLPFAEDGAGNALCLDLAPTASGRVGQVIEFLHDHGKRTRVATSFVEWLERAGDDLRAGRLVATESGDGSFFGVLRRASLTRNLATLRVRGESSSTHRARVRREMRDVPRALLSEVLPRLCSSKLLELAPEATKLTPARLALHQVLITELETATTDDERAEAIVRALRASPSVRNVRATARDVLAIFEALASA